jgi:hypothetical protein
LMAAGKNIWDFSGEFIDIWMIFLSFVMSISRKNLFKVEITIKNMTKVSKTLSYKIFYNQ